LLRRESCFAVNLGDELLRIRRRSGVPRNRRVIVVEWAGSTEAVQALREELAVARKAADGCRGRPHRSYRYHE